MKKRNTAILALLCVALLSACASDSDLPSAEESSDAISFEESVFENSEEISYDVSEEESQVIIDKKIKAPIPENAELITNLNYTNPGKMGDCDGPAVCVYAPEGYNKGILDVALSDIRINTKRSSDKKHLNGYIFIGIDVLSEPGGYWINCFDTGLCYDGSNGTWQLFHNIYENTDPDESRWYTSRIKLDDTHDYRIEVDSSFEDEKCTVNIYDLTDGEKLVDTRTFTVKGLKCDGSNTAYYQNFALDFPENIMVEADGKVGSIYANADWEKTTLYSTDENVFMQNIRVIDAKLFKNGVAKQWDEGVLGLWPDMSLADIDYPCTTLIKGENYFDYRIDLDMNRG